jgi:hypothetical protein
MINKLVEAGEAYFQEYNRPFMKMSPTQWKVMQLLPKSIPNWDAEAYDLHARAYGSPIYEQMVKNMPT